MIPLSSLLKRAREAFPEMVHLRYAHPTLYVICEHNNFEGLTEETRVSLFASKCGLDLEEVLQFVSANTVELALVTSTEKSEKYSFLDGVEGGHHWIEYLSETVSPNQVPSHNEGGPDVLHFYGFKGGQARSTILMLLAKQMADDGYRVLTVDTDLEAPSLDLLFNVKLPTSSGTLLDLGISNDIFAPISAYTPRQGKGTVDLIPCRPSGAIYDLDYAAFTLKASLDAQLPEQIAKNIYLKAKEKNYDFIFFDHRSGISTSILPIMAACPGPVAICLRLDDQSSAALGFFKVLLRRNVDYPGFFISFSLDPEDTKEKMLNRNTNQIELLLNTLGDSLALGAIDESVQLTLSLGPDELSEYWIPWFHDRALLSGNMPPPSELSKVNVESLHRIRSLLGHSGQKEIPAQVITPLLTGSGATDKGLFIETEALRNLLPENTPHRYIFGRKGTGKTRLLRELADRRLGEPLVVASDFQGQNGIPSSNNEFQLLSESFRDDPESFWWAILASALELQPFATREELLASINKTTASISNTSNTVYLTKVVGLVKKQASKRIFLIDGIETAFLSSQIIKYLEALFKFLLTLQNDSTFERVVTVRLFLRTDLARRAFQNIEQQVSGRVIFLSWDTQGILNFVLSRITALRWFKTMFKDVVQEIIAYKPLLVTGSLSIEECDRLLSKIFPQKIRRNNLLTLTFLKTYFSDSAGETATYYPRIYDRFLTLIDNPSELGNMFSAGTKIEEDRVSQSLIFAAHERAAKDYLQQVEAELIYLLELSPDRSQNANLVGKLLQAFAGLPTPFSVDECVRELKQKLQDVTEAAIRTALVQMRDVGIFEERPGYAGEWRVGRLFKASLGMKYVR